MTNSAEKFVDKWISENVQPTGYEPEGDASHATRLAFACWAAADQARIKRADIEAACGDLVGFMAAAIERVNDEEVERLASKAD